MRASELQRPTFDPGFLRVLVWATGATPGCLLAWDAAHHALGVNGVNYAIRTTGMLVLVFLVLTLAVTPLRKLTGVAMLIAVRRSLGLFAFGYLVLHVSLFYGLDRAASLASTIHEIVTRRYLQIGTIALVLMVPLAATSTNGMVRRLGATRWKKLHRLTYLVAALGCVHYTMLVKADVRQPLAFGAVVAVLLGWRALGKIRASRAPRAPRPWSGELRVVRVTDEVPDVRTIRLADRSGGPLPFAFAPGQYLNVAFRLGDETVRRSYTIASSAEQRAYCEITVRRDGRVSRHIHEAVAEGQAIAITAPAGRFVFAPEPLDEHVTLIGGGVGITPLMAILRTLVDRRWRGRITMVLSMRTEREIIFREELAQLARKLENLRVTVTLTREEGESWTGRRGKLGRDALAEILGDRPRGPIYLCGPDAMMRDVRSALRDLGAPSSDIRTEAFVSPGAPRPDRGGDDEVREITFEREGLVVASPRRLTLLETAEDAGVDIAFECRSGICGQCKVTLLAGEVTMTSEDALSPTEKADGVVLACQACPRTDIVVDA